MRKPTVVISTKSVSWYGFWNQGLSAYCATWSAGVAGFIHRATTAAVVRIMKMKPVRPRLPLKTLSDTQPHSSVPGMAASS